MKVAGGRLFSIPWRWICLFTALCTVWPGGSASAQNASGVYSARALGVGGAVRAFPTDGTAVDVNPAGMAGFSTYLVEADYRYFAPQAAHAGTLSFVDALTSRVASGFRLEMVRANNLPGPPPVGWSVVGDTSRDTSQYRARSYRLGFGLPVHERVLLGTTLAWYREKTASAPVLEDTAFSSAFSFSVGTLVLVSPAVRLALVGTNMVPTHMPAYPTTVGLGVSGVAADLVVGTIDLVADLTSARDLGDATGSFLETALLDVHAGLQAMLGRHFPLRVGFYTENQTGARYLTAGLGVESLRTRLGYTIQVRVKGATEDPAFDGPITHLLYVGSAFGKTL